MHAFNDCGSPRLHCVYKHKLNRCVGRRCCCLKACKTAISTALPVVGGIISDAAGTVVAGAEAMRNTLGVFGMVALLAICVSPFAVMALNYIGYKLTAAAVKSFGCARLGELTGCIGSAVGMLLGLVGCCAMILFVSMAVSIKAVGG